MLSRKIDRKKLIQFLLILVAGVILINVTNSMDLIGWARSAGVRIPAWVANSFSSISGIHDAINFLAWILGVAMPGWWIGLWGLASVLSL